MKEKMRAYLGDKAFYKMAFGIIIPVVVQQLILSIAGYVDNLMISAYSGASYTGVSTANRFMFLVNFFWIGLGSGISIFIAQYFGAKDKKKISGTLQLAALIVLIFGLLSSIGIWVFGPQVIRLFIPGSSSDELAAISEGIHYLRIIGIGAFVIFLNFMVATVYRSLGHPKIPMYAGIIGIVVNIIMNSILIFGLFGTPALGATGAAIGTVVSKGVELAILLIIALFYDQNKYLKNVFTGFNLDHQLVKLYLIKGTPILLNEVLWAIGVQVLARLITGGNYVWLTAFNYSQNVTDLFFIYFAGLATGTAILVGTALGEGDFPKARDYAKKLIGITIMASILAMVLLVSVSPLLLLILTPVGEVYTLSYQIIVVSTPFIILYGMNAVIFFILRAGGDSLRAFLLDQLPTFLLGIPLAFLLHAMEPKWQLGIILIFLATRIVDVVKIFLALFFYRQETWVQNLTTLGTTFHNEVAVKEAELVEL